MEYKILFFTELTKKNTIWKLLESYIKEWILKIDYRTNAPILLFKDCKVLKMYS